VAVSEDECDDYWTCSADVGCNLGTYDAEGQRVLQVLDTSAHLQHFTITPLVGSLSYGCYGMGLLHDVYYSAFIVIFVV